MSEHSEEGFVEAEPVVAPPMAGFAPVAAGPAGPGAALPAPGASLAGLGTRFANVDRQVAARMVLDIGRGHGNAAVARALNPQERVESVTGYDLSGATVHESSDTAATAGVDGLAAGTDVHLAPGVSPGTAHGDHVLAHELAHVVQQGTGRAAGLDAGRRGALESDAESVASRAGTVAQPAPMLLPLPSPREMAVQLFDPRYHRTSLINGLAGSGFTPDEVGAIYAANWERDLSQAHPSLGNIILAWKTVKVAAYESRLTETEIAGFQGACQSTLEAVMLEVATTGSAKGFTDATAYGGYQFYEHMDNPVSSEDPNAAPKMTAALKGKNTSGLPDHIYISREYIKQMLHEAAALSHPDLATMPTGQVADDSRATLDALGPPTVTPTPGGNPASAVAAETSLEGRGHGAVSGGGATLDPAAYDKIGRASHALQDFWSHSNFVERAIGDPEFELGGLTTATFGADDKTHALSHKIRGAADEIDAEMALVDRMSGRRDTDPAPSEVTVGDESPVTHEDDAQDLFDAVGQAGDVLKSLPGNVWRGAKRGYERGAAAGTGGIDSTILGIASGAEGAVVGTVASVMGSKGGVTALRRIAEYLDESTEEKQLKTGDFQAHGLLAKDQPGHEDDAFGTLKTAKFNLAHALSTEADTMIVGPMKGIVEAADAAEADAKLQEVFTLLDDLIADASPGHPLWGTVEAHRAEAEEALNAYLASKEAAPSPSP